MSAIRPIVALISLLLAFVIPVGTASAVTPTECTDAIQAARATATTASFANERDRSSVVVKLDEADEKVAIGKAANAAEKLADARLKVEKLAAAGKLGADDATVLRGQLDAAIGCVNGVGAAA